MAKHTGKALRSGNASMARGKVTTRARGKQPSIVKGQFPSGHSKAAMGFKYGPTQGSKGGGTSGQSYENGYGRARNPYLKRNRSGVPLAR